MSFPESIDRRIKASIPSRQILLGRVVSANRKQAFVSGIGEQPVECRLSSVFSAEVEMQEADIVGKLVEIHVIDGQSIVAYTIVTGENNAI